MLLRAQNLKKEFGIQTILDIEALEIHDGDRIGLVGRNGTGKSTLLHILSGRQEADAGRIIRNCEIAEILQSGETDGEAEGSYISRLRIRDSACRSGGERTRRSIAAAFSRHAPLLFADEPTTNLDVEGIRELEKMLAGYRGAVLLVSHDRMLLDLVCNQIWELEEGKLRIYPGNYSAWRQQRQREREFRQFEYEQYQKEKKRLEKNIRQVRQEGKKAGKPPKRMSSSEWMLYKGTASIQQGHVQNRAKAMESRLEHLEVKERPKDLPEVSMKLGEQQKIKSGYAVKAEHINVSYELPYGGHVVLRDASIRIPAGKKCFLTGENGCGKTTLIEQVIRREAGTWIASDAVVGYFSQNHEILDFNKTVLENVMEDAVVPEHISRAVLANLYMSRNDIEKPVSVLSGGERVKTAMAKLLVSGCNFLILDEPTNHMDIYTMEGLERLLESFDGTAWIVSHDRAFTAHLADVVYEVRDGIVQQVELDT